MHNLGQTRSSQQRNHLLLTADTFVRTTLPGMKKCSAIARADMPIYPKARDTALWRRKRAGSL